MLRITIHESPAEVAINLEGRVTGPWAEELGQIWKEASPRLNSRRVSVDLRDVTWADSDGKRILREIEQQTGAVLIATTPWTRQLVDEICNQNVND
jgi:hypothetical protein